MLFLSFQTGWADFLLTSDARGFGMTFFVFMLPKFVFILVL